MGTTEGAGVEKDGEGPVKNWENEQPGKMENEQPGKSWVVLEERNQGSIGLPLLPGFAKSHRHGRWLPFLKYIFELQNCFAQN